MINKNSTPILIIPFAASALALLISVKFLPYPLIWTAFALAVSFLYTAVRIKRSRARLVCFNIALLLIFLTIIESALWITYELDFVKKTDNSIANGNYMIYSDILGDAPTKDISIASKSYFRDETIFDATYTIGPDGLRITAPIADPDKGCVLFFGGSFTFGHGVGDNETTPFVVGEITGRKVYNFAFDGYGPHQMLSAIRTGLVKETVDCKPTHAVYQVIKAHIQRVSGRGFWDTYGPRFVLEGNGLVRSAGNFRSKAAAKRRDWLFRSIITFKAFNRFFYRSNKYRADEAALFFAIVEASKKELTKLYPEIEFHAVQWDNRKHKLYAIITEGFKKREIETHYVSEILPNIEDYKQLYAISADHNRHPNKEAHRIVGEYIASNIVTK
ncbi:MAG: hypothetical protein V3T30_03020 [Thermodesulfobacteriota bacterium]